MLLVPAPLGSRRLTPEVLESDKKSCRRIGPCGVGREALYVGARYRERRYYLPWREVKRVFKRVAMSRGGFSGKGMFGALAYFVVQYGSGKETQCRFRNEADVDRLLELIGQEHPDIPTHSVQAERKLAQAAQAEEARYKKELSPEGDEAVKALRRDLAFLEARSDLTRRLESAARQKRIADGMSPAYRIGGAVLGIAGILAAAAGLSALLYHRPWALYLVIGGAAVFFLTLSTNTFPGRWNSRKTAQNDWDRSVSDMAAYLRERPDFVLPPQYAHPVVLERVIRVLREGRAKTADEAFALMKKDLKALNASVTVSQKEHDEVVKIKPLFLVCDYRDELE